MRQGRPNLVDGLLKAIKAEREGHSFYEMAASASVDPKAKQVFAQLAQQELQHMDFLRAHYESVMRTGKPSQSAHLGSPKDLSGLSPIFSEAIQNRIQEAHFEMSALSIGIRLELDAMTFYKKTAEATDNPDARGFYSELAEWESGHYQALLRQQEQLKEDYWSASGFAPF